MSDRQDPPAFPVVASHQVYSHGMMLRDYFAAQALASVGTWIPVHGGANLGSKTAMMARALWAYEQADAMLATREGERLMSRFTNIPARLREVASFDADQRSDMGSWLAAQGTIEDAALKIEALERELARHKADRPYIIGWNDGFDHATSEHEEGE